MNQLLLRGNANYDISFIQHDGMRCSLPPFDCLINRKLQVGPEVSRAFGSLKGRPGVPQCQKIYWR
jgi:hypothetical protein